MNDSIGLWKKGDVAFFASLVIIENGNVEAAILAILVVLWC